MKQSSNTEILNKYFSPDAIKLAYYRVQCWTDRASKDQVGLRAFGYELDKNCKSLSNRILEKQYMPERGFKYYMPKASKTLRTRTTLNVEDALVYQAIANQIAENCQPRLVLLDDFVFGSVLSPEVTKGTKILDEAEPSLFFFKFWKSLFKKFKESLIHSIRVDKVKFKFETDITGFFDSIPHYNLLFKLSKEFNVEDEILDLLGECFNIWSGTKESLTPGVGIPQGPQPSFFFANLLLHKLDDLLVSEGFKYYRYMDDIHIYGYDEKELLDALLKIDKYTKGNGLSINSKKTSIEAIKEDEAEEISKQIKTIYAFSTYAEDDPEDKHESGSSDNLDRQVIKLSEQDHSDESALQSTTVELIEDRDKIIAFWRSTMREVEQVLPSFFTNPKDDIGSLRIQDSIDDTDFISISIKYANGFHALKELDQAYELDKGLIKFWLTSYRKYFWRVNILGLTLMNYGPNDILKIQLTEMLNNDFSQYEWVRYYITMHLSLSQKFVDRELRQVYFTNLRSENSDLAKISYYRLLFMHTRNSQFISTLSQELRKESSLFLKLTIADFTKNHMDKEKGVTEFWKAVGL